MTDAPLPGISVIIPTLNAAGVLPVCLKSVRAQDYPADRMQILIPDGGSTDQTREVATSFGARVIENPFRIAESGKHLALAEADGEYVLFVDADNEITSADFMRLAVQGLKNHPQALGVESYYPAAPGMSSFAAYLTETLHISDPIARMMCVRPVRVSVDGEVERWAFPGDSLAYPLGANGFLFRKTDLDSIRGPEHFEDAQVALKLALAGKKEWLRLCGRGVHHYIARGPMDFLKKRRRQAYHFLSLKNKSDLSWTRMKPRMPGWAACLLCGTLIVPMLEMVCGLVRTRDRRWLWHPLACLLSATGLIWGVLTFLLFKRTSDREASLQPVQRGKRGAE